VTQSHIYFLGVAHGDRKGRASRTYPDGVPRDAGLCLTRWQATRLWNLEPTLWDDLLAVLVGEGFLVKTREGLFLRRHDERAACSLTA
jgi:hypothetical protein